MAGRRSILVLSHVLPVQPRAGQQQRVAYTLAALREHFHVVFATATPHTKETGEALARCCDEVVVIPVERGPLERRWNSLRCRTWAWTTGLKSSNYRIGHIDFAPPRLARALGDRRFDAVLFEYWHAADSVPFFQSRGIPCVLDMHNVLWQAYSRHLEAESPLPKMWRQWAAGRYRDAEEESWTRFAGVIAINRAELEYVRHRVPVTSRLFYAPMGVDVSRWPYGWSPRQPLRLAYYGGLGSVHNCQQAMICAREVMPEVWKTYPAAELWIIGSNPPENIRALCTDSRIRVTGFVEDVAAVLRDVSAVLCPWQGTYGFRSRLIEVMGVGTPIVALADTVFGMDLENGRDLYIAPDPAEMAHAAISLYERPAEAVALSERARTTAETIYGYDATYGRLAREMNTWLSARAAQSQCA
jgi:glycosyltransferase involved in cell wall biosynthesis